MIENREIYFENPIPEIIDILPHHTPEETLEWKIQRRSRYSKRYIPKSFKELQAEHPSGVIEDDNFLAYSDDENGHLVKKVFNNLGYEIERCTYEKGMSSENASNKSLLRRVASHYDADGYLSSVIELEAGKGGYVREIEYESAPANLKTPLNSSVVVVKIPKLLITRDVLPRIGDNLLKKPGWPVSYRPPKIIDFTNVPYLLPAK